MAGKKVAKKGKGKKPAPAARKKAGSRGFKTYVYRVLKNLHGKKSMGASKKTMTVMNSFLLDLFDQIAREAGSICKYSKRQTLGAREVQAAVSLVLPGELALNAVSEGT